MIVEVVVVMMMIIIIISIIIIFCTLSIKILRVKSYENLKKLDV